MKVFNKLFLIVDEIFKIVSIFMICFVWNLYYFKDFGQSLAFSCLLTVSIVFFIKIISNLKTKKKNEIKNSNKNIEQLKNYFLLSTAKTNLEFIAKIFNNFNQNDTYLQNDNSIVLPYVNKTSLSINNLLLICQIFEDKTELNIICQSYEKGCDLFASKISPLVVKITTVEQLASKINLNEIKLETKLQFQTKKSISFKFILQNIVSQEKSKNYFLCSIFVVLSMFFVPYKIYYAIVATILLTLSLISKFYPKQTKHI